MSPGVAEAVIYTQGYRMSRHTPHLDILYEDDAMLVINKPAGLLVIPDRWDPDKLTVGKVAAAYLHGQGYPLTDEAHVWIVHRLDRETSGVLILAKSVQAHAAMSQQFEQGEVRKSYLALVRGHVPQVEGIVELPIGPHPHKPGLMAVRPRQGKAALTRYTVLERFRGFTLLGVQPETGRTHQIRVHLRAIGHPLAIDSLYGGHAAIFLSALKPSYRPQASGEERALMARLTLHAQALQVTHPTHGGIRHWMAPLPKDFAALLRNLRRFQRLLGEPPPPPAAPGGDEESGQL